MNSAAVRLRKSTEQRSPLLTKATTEKSSSDLSRHMGKRLRELRSMKRITQTQLGEKLGVSFQQIQKYEKGNNHLNCDRLLAVAKILDVRINYFFEGYQDYEDHQGVDRRTPPNPVGILDSKSVQLFQLLGDINRIEAPLVRTALLRLIKSLSANEVKP